MSVQALSWAMAQQPRSPSAKLVLIGLANACDMDGEVSIEGVCAFSGISPDGLRLIIESLLRDGFIVQCGGRLRLACPLEGDVPSHDPSPTLRRRVLEESGFACAACGATERLCVDHIMPKRRGGKGNRENLQVLCAPCNTSKGGKLPENWKGRPS